MSNKPAWKKKKVWDKNPQTQPKVNSAGCSVGPQNAKAKFLEAQAKLQSSVQKHLDNGYESSSEEEELESEKVISSLLRQYSIFGGTTSDLGKTETLIENAFFSGAVICLICIATVKRTDPTWNCDACYGVFHLLCIQRWAKDKISHTNFVAEAANLKDAPKLWQCPKCRKDYDSKSIPNRYECFCTKVVDPPFHPWLVPHSCGETCNKPLVPACGHTCLLLCHPGPCPPCPKTVDSKCFCGRSAPIKTRCSRKERSCYQVCGKLLSCSLHTCPEPCHPNGCPPCPHTSKVSCVCGSSSRLNPCSQPQWKCDKVCRKKFSCGIHFCEEVCHQGDCGECPRSLPRSCPCGEYTDIYPCSKDPQTCGNTCGKILDCSLHYCSKRCHKGPCGPCQEFQEKACRCGLHKKEVICSKEYLCDTKCKRMRDCRNHTCNRRCCDGACPPCEKSCGRFLNCGQHKCTSICHLGICYPCTQTKEYHCRCGAAVISLPCGSVKNKKKLTPPCNKPCMIPPDCHHETRVKHRCHFGDCPPCKQICSKERPCGHSCSIPCHSSVLVNTAANFKPATPCELGLTKSYVLKSIDCPPCPVLVPCPGQHGDKVVPCYASLQSCGRSCGRLLECGNHTCSLLCHQLTNPRPNNGFSDDCEKCTSDCSKKERKCNHLCESGCHPGPCTPCNITLRLQCHCQLNQVYIKCNKLHEADEDTKETILSCTNQCPKTYSCGHRCTKLCHSDPCMTEGVVCKKKVKLSCPCKRIKKQVQCNLIVPGQTVVSCSDECKIANCKTKTPAKLEEHVQEECPNAAEIEKVTFPKSFVFLLTGVVIAILSAIIYILFPLRGNVQ